MKRFHIWDGNSQEFIKGMNLEPIEIEARDGKSALRKFQRNFVTSSGMFETHQRCGRWVMTSTYGGWWTAVPK